MNFQIFRRTWLWRLKVKSNLLQWIRAFLNDRTQCVYVGLDVSSPKSITSGVPRGSVLGPILFLIYVNDLPNHVQSPAGIKIFADDTKLYLDLTPSKHCSSIAAMAFNRSCLLLKCFHSNDVVRLYKVYVRPLLESNTQVWNPWFHA